MVINLAQFDEQWANIVPIENEFDEVPDGTYNVIVEKLELTESQNRNPMLKWTLSIVDDLKHNNRKIFRNNMIASPENLRWLKTDLANAGLEIVKVSELENPDTRMKLIGVKLQVQKKTKKHENEEFVNVYIRKRLSNQQNVVDKSTLATNPHQFQPQSQTTIKNNLPPL